MFLGKFFNCHSKGKFPSNHVVVELQCFRHKTFIHNTHPATLQPFSVTATKRLQQTCNPIQTLGYITTKKDHKHMTGKYILEDPDKWIEDINGSCPATTATHHLDVFNDMVGSELEPSADAKPANYVPTFEHMALLAIGSDSDVEIDEKIHWVKAKLS